MRKLIASAGTKENLEKKFKHRTWFKEGVTVGFALDYFAKTSDFYLNKKPALKQSGNLLDAIIYDDIITDGRCFYRLSEEEKQYYLERKEYYKEQRELEYKKWLNTEIDKKKELSSYLCCNSNYDVKEAEKQLNYAKEDDDKERIDYWKNQVEIRLKKHNFIDSFINKFFDKVVTNKDFMEFKDRLKMELETI